MAVATLVGGTVQVHREFQTFEELRAQWALTSNDMKRLIVDGSLKPSVFVREPCMVMTLVDDMGLFPRPVFDGRGEPLLEEPESPWVYLHSPSRTGPLECVFNYASEHQDAPAAEGELLFELPRPLDMDAVERSAVFMEVEVKRLEGPDQQSPPENVLGELSGKSRTAMFNIVGGLLELMLETTPGGRRGSLYDDQGKIVEELGKRYPGKTGLSESNLSRVFPQARNSLKG